jgi:hypothetical protein
MRRRSEPLECFLQCLCAGGIAGNDQVRIAIVHWKGAAYDDFARQITCLTLHVLHVGCVLSSSAGRAAPTLSATSGCEHSQQNPRLFDHLVSAGQQHGNQLTLQRRAGRLLFHVAPHGHLGGPASIDVARVVHADAFRRAGLDRRLRYEGGDLAVLDAADADALLEARIVARGRLRIRDVDHVVLGDGNVALVLRGLSESSDQQRVQIRRIPLVPFCEQSRTEDYRTAELFDSPEGRCGVSFLWSLRICVRAPVGAHVGADKRTWCKPSEGITIAEVCHPAASRR